RTGTVQGIYTAKSWIISHPTTGPISVYPIICLPSHSITVGPVKTVKIITRRSIGIYCHTAPKAGGVAGQSTTINRIRTLPVTPNSNRLVMYYPRHRHLRMRDTRKDKQREA